MKQHVDVTVKLSLWLDATLGEDEIATYIRSSLPLAFGEDLTAMINPVDILDIREEAAIYNPPPDPEGMNDERALWAATALAAFQEATGTDAGDALTDLLCDLKHWCDRNDTSFLVALERAQWHYDAETEGDVV